MQAGAASMDVELHPLLPRRPFSWTAGAAARFRGSYNRRPWELRPKLELQPWMAGSCNRPPGELHAVNGDFSFHRNTSATTVFLSCWYRRRFLLEMATEFATFIHGRASSVTTTTYFCYNRCSFCCVRG
ncbi:hypothetical protein ACQJBY_072209 [Aegilops geniculata]